MRKEWLARSIVLILLAAAVVVPAADWWQRSQGSVIHARMAETGGWTPENLTARVGEPLHLRLTSDDVTHSFAIGQSDQAPVDVLPGEITEITLVFDKPGKYTFYCTRWCSINHWRMRGVIDVSGPETASAPPPPPLYVTLGLDIDAEHHAENLPAQKPSALRGAALGRDLPEAYRSRQAYLTHTPEELWQTLRADPAYADLSEQETWDLVALAWQMNITRQEVESGRNLYAINCAACHGGQGGGDGVFSDELAVEESPEHAQMDAGEMTGGQMTVGQMTGGQMTARPTDFTAAEHMLAASPAHLQGKILRGGMGTGMPYWGPIFTEEQTWALVAYLWTFQFEMEAP